MQANNKKDRVFTPAFGGIAAAIGSLHLFNAHTSAQTDFDLPSTSDDPLHLHHMEATARPIKTFEKLFKEMNVAIKRATNLGMVAALGPHIVDPAKAPLISMVMQIMNNPGKADDHVLMFQGQALANHMRQQKAGEDGVSGGQGMMANQMMSMPMAGMPMGGMPMMPMFT
eukprot:Polyplicarium_translucidae@DN537_c0_g1_i1.p1